MEHEPTNGRNGNGHFASGNSLSLKFKTSDERRALCESYCKHAAQGLSRESFPLCDPATLKRYVRDFPADFDTEKMREAETQGRMLWEKIGLAGAIGLNEVANPDGSVTKLRGFNAASWIFNMKNRYGWRDVVNVHHSGSVDLNVVRERIASGEVTTEQLKRLAQGEPVNQVFADLRN